MRKSFKSFIIAMIMLATLFFTFDNVKMSVAADSIVGTFDLCNGTVLNELPTEAPKWKDYKFVGWYTKEILGEKVESGFAPNKTYYAHWETTNYLTNTLVFTETLRVNENGILYGNLQEGDEITNELDKDYNISFSIDYKGNPFLYIYNAEINAEEVGILVETDITIGGTNSGCVIARPKAIPGGNSRFVAISAIGYDLTISGQVSAKTEEVKNFDNDITAVAFETENLNFINYYAKLNVINEKIEVTRDGITIDTIGLWVRNKITGTADINVYAYGTKGTESILEIGVFAGDPIKLGVGSNININSSESLFLAVYGSFYDGGANVKIKGSADDTQKEMICQDDNHSPIAITVVEPYHFALGNGEVLDYFEPNPVWDDHKFIGWYDSDFEGNLVTMDGETFEEPFTGFELGKTYYAYWQISETDDTKILLHPITVNANGILINGNPSGTEVLNLNGYGIYVTVEGNAGVLHLDGAFICAPGTALSINMYNYLAYDLYHYLDISKESYVIAYPGDNDFVRAIYVDSNLTIRGNSNLYAKSIGTLYTAGHSAYAYGIYSDRNLKINTSANVYSSSANVNQNDATRTANTFGIHAGTLEINNGNLFAETGDCTVEHEFSMANRPVDAYGLVITGGKLICSFSEAVDSDYKISSLITNDNVESIAVSSSININKFDWLSSYQAIDLGEPLVVTYEPAYIFDKYNGEWAIDVIPETIPEWDDHVFVGWYDSPIGGNLITEGFVKGVRYYAHWQISNTNTNLVFPETIKVTSSGMDYLGSDVLADLTEYGIDFDLSESTLYLADAFICAKNGAISVTDCSLTISIGGNTYIGTYSKNCYSPVFATISVSNGNLTLIGDPGTHVTIQNKDYSYDDFMSPGVLAAISGGNNLVIDIEADIITGDLLTYSYTTGTNAAIYNFQNISIYKNTNIVTGNVPTSSNGKTYAIYIGNTNNKVIVDCETLSLSKGNALVSSPIVNTTFDTIPEHDFNYSLTNGSVKEDGVYQTSKGIPTEYTYKPTICIESIEDVEPINYGTMFEGYYYLISLKNVLKDDLTLEWSTGSDSWGTTAPTGIDVLIEENGGKLYIKITTLDNVNASNYLFRITNGKDEVLEADEFVCALGYVSINKVAPTVINAPTPKENLKYTGQPQELINPGEVIGGHYEYAVDYNNPFGLSVPTATDNNYYSVYYRLVGDENHTSGPEGYNDYFFISIGSGQIEFITDPSAIDGLKYTGSKQQLVNNGVVNGGTIQYSFDYNANNPWMATWIDDISKVCMKDAGEYTIWYRGYDSSYKFNETEAYSITATIGVKAIDENPFSVFGTYAYSGSPITPYLDSTIEDVEYTISFGELVNHTDVNKNIPFTVTLTGNYSGSFDMTFDINAKALTENPFNQNITLEYNNEDLTPTLSSSLVGLTYTISFENGVNHKNADINIPFTVTLTGNYSGSFDMTFDILPKEIEDNPFTLVGTYTYDKAIKNVEVDCSIDDETVDYEITYGIGDDLVNARTNIPFTVTLKGNYAGSFAMTFDILPQAIDVNPFTLVGTYTYNKAAITPTVSCSIEGATYEISIKSCSDNVNANTNIPFTVTLTGNYSGSFAMAFDILPQAIDVNPFTLVGTYTYNKAAITPTVSCSIDGATYELSIKSGSDNVNANTNIPFTVTLTGNYSGSFDMAFDILPQAIDVNPFTVTGTYVFNGNEIIPSYTCSIEGATFEGSKVSAVNYVDANKNVIYKVKLTGNYSGDFVLIFDINQLEITVTPTENQSKIYGSLDGEINYTFTPALIGADQFTGSLTREEGNNVGSYKILVGTLALSNNYKINFVENVNYEIKVRELNKTDIDIEITDSDFKFNGNEIKPNVVIKDMTADKQLVLDTDYTVQYENNVNAGVGSIVVTLKGNYNGTNTKEFNIAKLGVDLAWSNDDYKKTGSVQSVSVTYVNEKGETVNVDKITYYVDGVACEFKEPNHYEVEVEITNNNYLINGSKRKNYVINEIDYADNNNAYIVIEEGLDPSYKLNIINKDVNESKDIVKSSDGHKAFDKQVYVCDLAIVDKDSNNVELTSEATAKILIPEVLQNKQFRVFTVNGDKAELVEYEVSDGYVVFKTNSLNQYVFVKTNIIAIIIMIICIILGLAIIACAILFVLKKLNNKSNEENSTNQEVANNNSNDESNDESNEGLNENGKTN